jgi:hypothetical protein
MHRPGVQESKCQTKFLQSRVDIQLLLYSRGWDRSIDQSITFESIDRRCPTRRKWTSWYIQRPMIVLSMMMIWWIMNDSRAVSVIIIDLNLIGTWQKSFARLICLPLESEPHVYFHWASRFDRHFARMLSHLPICRPTFSSTYISMSSASIVLGCVCERKLITNLLWIILAHPSPFVPDLAHLLWLGKVFVLLQSEMLTAYLLLFKGVRWAGPFYPALRSNIFSSRCAVRLVRRFHYEDSVVSLLSLGWFDGLCLRWSLRQHSFLDGSNLKLVKKSMLLIWAIKIHARTRTHIDQESVRIKLTRAQDNEEETCRSDRANIMRSISVGYACIIVTVARIIKSLVACTPENFFVFLLYAHGITRKYPPWKTIRIQ